MRRVVRGRDPVPHLGRRSGDGPVGQSLTVMLAGAVAGATRRGARADEPLAAHLLEVDADELAGTGAGRRRGARVPRDGRHAGRDRAPGHRRALDLPPGVRSGLETTFTYDHTAVDDAEPDGSGGASFSPIIGHTVHIPVVEVDLETGVVDILDYYVLHDCGTVVNPEAVRGQVVGGVCQGIGTASTEACATTSARTARDRLPAATRCRPSSTCRGCGSGTSRPPLR